jgi:hypothetical protein
VTEALFRVHPDINTTIGMSDDTFFFKVIDFYKMGGLKQVLQTGKVVGTKALHLGAGGAVGAASGDAALKAFKEEQGKPTQTFAPPRVSRRTT